MPSSIGLDSAFGVYTTNPAVAFDVTSSSTSSFAPCRPALVDLTAEQEQPIASSSSSGTGYGGCESFLWTMDGRISSVAVVIKR